MSDLIKLRRDTAATWTTVNPVLAAGEPGAETDTGKLKVGNGSATWSALPYVGGGATRATTAWTTASLAPAATETGTVTLATGYRLLTITTSVPARVRLYTTTTKRTADAARPVGTDPTGDHGLVLDYVTTASVLSADLSPTVDGFTPSGTAVPYAVTNLSGGSTTITTTLGWIRTE